MESESFMVCSETLICHRVEDSSWIVLFLTCENAKICLVEDKNMRSLLLQIMLPSD